MKITALLLIQIVYVLLVLFTILRVIYDTRNASKALAYILFIIFVPIAGILFYFCFGVNYRKRKLYDKKIITDESLRQKAQEWVSQYHQKIKSFGLLNNDYNELSDISYKSTGCALTANNSTELLLKEKKNSKLCLRP